MNIIFCKISEEHLSLVRNWRNNPEVSKYMYTEHYITEEEHLNWFYKIKNDPTKKDWIIQIDGRYVGTVNLYNIDVNNKRCYWGYYLGESSERSKGLGKIIEFNILNYVFEKLCLNKLCCEVLSFNEGVIRTHQKLGSKIEGVFRKHIYKNEIYYDIVCMAILKEEWEKEKKNFNFEFIEIE